MRSGVSPAWTAAAGGPGASLRSRHRRWGVICDADHRRRHWIRRLGLCLVGAVVCSLAARGQAQPAGLANSAVGTPGAALVPVGGAAGVPAVRPCPVAVRVEGDGALAPAITAELHARGLDSGGADGCPTTRVVVQRRDPHIWVELHDELRSAQRQVADRDTAVALIESWVRSDLSAPLLLGSIGLLAFPAQRGSTDPPAATGWPARGSLSLYGLAAADVAGNAWLGASLRGCVRVYRLCIGGAWQTLGQLDISAQEGRRVVTELIAHLALPVRLGRVWLWPSVGLGVSWLHVSARLPRIDGTDDEIEIEDGVIVSGSSVAASTDQGHLLAEARIELSIPLRYRLSLAMALSLDATLTQRTAPLLMGPPNAAGQASTNVVPLSVPPWGLVIGGLGLLWSPK